MTTESAILVIGAICGVIKIIACVINLVELRLHKKRVSEKVQLVQTITSAIIMSIYTVEVFISHYNTLYIIISVMFTIITIIDIMILHSQKTSKV